MALDAQIPLMAQPPKINMPFETLGQALSLRQMIRQGQAQDEQIRAAQAEQAAQQRIGQTFQALIQGQMTPDDFLSVNGPAGLDVLKGVDALQAIRQKRATDARAAAGQVLTAFDKFPPAMQAQLWPQIRQAASEGGLGDLPEQVTPDLMAGLKEWAGISPPAPKYQAVAPGTPVVDMNNPQAGPVYTSPPVEKPDQPVYRINPSTGKVEQIGSAPAGAHFVQEPRPPVVNIGGAGADLPPIQIDPESTAILAQTGLSQNAFLAATGQISSLGRDAKTRSAANREWQNYAVKHGVDTSTFIPRYKAITKTIEANALRNNQAEVAEAELDATLKNLGTAADEASFRSLRWSNVAAMFAGKEINDPAISKYKFHLEQLREEFAMYNAAIAGQIDSNGNIREITDSDRRRAETIIRDGFAAGSLAGFESALKASREKMKTVLDNSIEIQNKRVWDLFGVGKNYKSKAGSASGERVRVKGPNGQTGTVPKGTELPAGWSIIGG